MTKLQVIEYGPWATGTGSDGPQGQVPMTLNDANEGKVVASAWVCVYSLSKARRRVPLSQFEPERWSYADEQNASNDVSKETFYEIGD